MVKESALEILHQKRDALQAQEAFAADPSLKFQLLKQIQEIEDRIAELSRRPGDAPNSDLPAVVPQGLKSFGEESKDFFLRLLPGPYHENGLPESLHFWKRQIEQTDADETFRVGVIYGKSGCGKSSWIKAGLLPRLEGVTSVYVEAIPDGTPQRLLTALRKRCPWLGDAASLADALQRKDHIPATTKVLLVLDQFEQWLHGRTEENYAELLDALQACDGARVQCLLLIRSDFWDLLTRFLQRLEIRQEEGKNLAMFDLFDKRHARHVLRLFGEAYGALPKTGDLTPDQELFLSQAVEGLADEGRIVSVRLSLFAEMLKRRDWTPATLKQIGGTSGVGFAFLEESFSAKDAPRQYHRHEAAVRAVLEQLLPAVGTDIKGAMRSEEELRRRAGYERRPDDFAELLQILNRELRLISPTAPADAADNEQATRADSPSVAAAGAKYYQLTHDYLVPSLREWLTARQKATRRGRAQLRLAERSAAWNAKPEKRHLPAWWEYLNIRGFTRSRDWTEPQQKMMRAAGRLHALRWSVALTILIVASFAGSHYIIGQRFARAEGYINAAISARPDGLPRELADVRDLADYARVILEKRFGKDHSLVVDSDLKLSDQLHALCALAAVGDVPVKELVEHVNREPFHPVGECPNIVAALQDSRELAFKEIRRAAAAKSGDRNPNWTAKARLASVALSLGDATLAHEMCQLSADPSQRTAFIKAFPAWHGNRAKLKDTIDSLKLETDPALLSALCLGVGSLARVDQDKVDFTKWKPLLDSLFSTHPNSAVHSSAGWAIRQWSIPEPTISPRNSPQRTFDWFETKSALTLIRIPAGTFVRKNDDDPNAKPQSVKLTHELWLSDREVTVKLFHEFVEDKAYAERYPAEAITEWKGEVLFGDSASALNHPVGGVSWEDAVRFCNWLSRRENLSVWYRLVKPGETELENKGTWKLNESATGYRLPTEAEWEYACRAGTAVEFKFCFGSEEEQLADYGWSDANSYRRTHPVGVKKPNSWGLHDMHGNVWEFCQDWYETFDASEVVLNPAGPHEGELRVIRGGSMFDAAVACRSSSRLRADPTSGIEYLGFRVARSPSVE